MSTQDCSRTYSVLTTKGRKFANWPGEEFISNARIRAFTILIFRHYFGGQEPTFHWHQDGFMAEARGNNGNSVEVTQYNWWHRYAPGATLSPRPACPMVIRKLPCPMVIRKEAA